MPYDPDDPPAKTRKLSAKKRRQWVRVFNSCWERHADEGKCHAMAWGVVKKSLTPEMLKDYTECCVEEVSPAVVALLKFSQQVGGSPADVNKDAVEWAGRVGFRACVRALRGKKGIDNPEQLCGWLKSQARERGVLSPEHGG